MQESNDSPQPKVGSGSSVPSIPAHLAFAIGEMGVLEVAGDGSNPRIEFYHAATRGGPAPDSVPWCSSFGNRCYLQAGIVGTRTKRARDWVEQTPLGFEKLPPEYIGMAKLGDALILRRGPGKLQGHFTFFFGRAGEKAVYGLGGNQGNEVNVTRYPLWRLLAIIRHRGE